MIYTVTLNPSLDYIMHVDDFQYGETNRSKQEEIYPGGKGFNVSMILQRLGIQNKALGFIAGFTGEEIENQLNIRGLDVDFITLAEGCSRINVKMKGKAETEINGAGPFIHEDELQLLYDQIENLQDGDLLILAGSIPGSLPKDIYEKIIELVQNKNIETVVDCTNQALIKVLPFHPFLVKPNQRELEEIFSCELHNDTEIIYAATKLQKMGAKNVLISLGGNGAILITDDNHIYKANVAKGKVINTVGSGDSMIAGFIAGYASTSSYEEALKMGSACGGATAFSADLAEKDMIDEVYKQIKIKKIEW